MPNHFAYLIAFLYTLATYANAGDRPSWAVVNAADRLIAKHALFLPARDGFVKDANGTLTQYELPTKKYTKHENGWRVEILSRRWRKRQSKGWTEWKDARPQYNTWRIGVIHVAVLASGVKATWIDNANFARGTAPGEAEVRQKLDTQGYRSTYTQHIEKPPQRQPSSATTRTRRIPQRPPGPDGLPAGMSRRTAPKTVTHARIAGTTPKVVHHSKIVGSTKKTTGSGISITPAPLAVVPPQSSSTPDDPSDPQKSPSSVPSLVDADELADQLTMPIKQIMPWLIGMVLVALLIQQVLRKSGQPSSQRTSSDSRNPHGTPPLPESAPQHDSRKPTATSSVARDLTNLLERKETLMTPAEQSFFDVLEPLVRSSCRVSSNVRLLDLFHIRPGSGQQSAFNKISRKHVDFVLTEHGSSRILCAIELDDSSHNRPDRIERDAFVNELFASLNLPLLRIPFSWTYNVPGLRSELLKAGVPLASAA